MESETFWGSLEKFSEVKTTLCQIFTELERALKKVTSLRLSDKPEFVEQVRININNIKAL